MISRPPPVLPSPPPVGARPQSAWRTVILTAVVTFAGTSLLWIGIGVAAYWYVQQGPAQFEVALDYPDTVAVGEGFTLRVEVANPTEDSLKLGSIDFYSSLLEGFEVTATTPKPDSEQTVWDFTSYYFSERLDPGEAFVFELELRAKESGYWAGDVDCCTPLESFVTAVAGIEVRESEE